MTIRQIMLGLTCVLGISVGQIMFKMAASNITKYESLVRTSLQYLNIYFIISLVIYAVTTVFWVWLLRDVSLGKAYSIMSIAFFIVPILSSLFLGENLEFKVMVGAGLIVLGIYISIR